ncbi:TetR family transcriptional regulator [Actinomadura sp. LD22]|uniref:TetR family transcriptional regulator n=1 Tax=Actinomadura physcomitrii TaxID=2650748 RepID=A0A6I4ME85_9ACTN|nr:TetR/AcrR family transcriptional regulator [Actinomadura physcomitrii]MWA03190.1 TetR family transcriptional regulator [Actinomadura physcomitrii]
MPTSAGRDKATPAEGSSRRRSPGTIRDIIVKAAAEVFEEKGYKSTTTREIAHRAGASETLIFRHFGNKSGLFRQAVMEPFAAELDALARSFDPSRPSREFFSRLLATLRTERRKIMALLTVSSFAEDPDLRMDEASASPIAPVFSSLIGVTEGDVEHYGFANVDVRLTTAISVATLLGLVAFDEWLFDEPLDDERLAALERETLMQLAHGLAHRPPSQPAGGSRP